MDIQSKTRRSIQPINILLGVMLAVFLSACNGSQTPFDVTETRSPIETSTQIPSDEPTVEPSKTETIVPTITPNPFGTPVSLDVISESFFQPPEIRAVFDNDLFQLPSGIYVLYAEIKDAKKSVGFISEDRTNQGLLTSLSGSLAQLHITQNPETVIGVGARSGIAQYVIDFGKKEIIRLEPVCNYGTTSASPDGSLLAVICTLPGERLNGEIVVEVVSIDDGSGYHLIIPTNDKVRGDNNHITWASNDELVANVGVDEEPCIINLTHFGMRCSSALRGSTIRAVSPAREYVFFIGGPPSEGPLTIYPFSCFEPNGLCEPVASFADQWLNFLNIGQWSPDGTKLAVSASNFVHEWTTVGIYDVETWTAEVVMRLEGNQTLVDWCPDSSCVLLDRSYNPAGSPGGNLVYIDGRKVALPDHVYIGVIQVP